MMTSPPRRSANTTSVAIPAGLTPVSAKMLNPATAIAPKILIAARAQPATAASVPRLRRRRNAYTLAATGPPGAAKPIAL